MNLQEKVKRDRRYTTGALLWLIASDKISNSDKPFLERLAKTYQLKKKLSDPQIKAARRIVLKYVDVLPDDLVGVGPIVKLDGSVSLTLGSRSCLKNAPETVVEAIKSELTISNEAYHSAVKYGRWISPDSKPFLYFFEEDDSEIVFPSGFTDRAIKIIQEHTQNKPTINDTRKLRPPIEIEFTGELRPYQDDAMEAILPRDMSVLESGTGSGKTVIGLAVIAERKQPTIIIVHSKELLYQWAERIKQFLGVTAGLIGDNHCSIKPITIAIVNSAKNRLDSLPQHFGQIIVDECHRVPASLFTDVVNAFDCRYKLGLSATAFRHDGLTDLINFYLGDTCHRVPVADLWESGAVLKPKVFQIKTNWEFEYRGSYAELIQKLTSYSPRNIQIVDDIVKEVRAGNTTVLVVSDRISHCRRINHLLKKHDVKVRMLTGRLNSEEREVLVKRVQKNYVEVLVSTVQLIGEGFDCPGLSTLFLTTPIKAKGRLLQVIGRILRPKEGKVPRIFDYVDPTGVLEKSARIRRQVYKGISV